jgi:hypothetical protein
VVRIPGYRSRAPRFDSRRYQIIWELVGLERRPLSLVSTIEELLGRKSSGSGLENREYGLRDPSRWPRDTLFSYKLALVFPTSFGRTVGIVRSRTQATELVFPLYSTAILFYTRIYGFIFIWNVDKYVPDYTVSHSLLSQPWETDIATE